LTRQQKRNLKAANHQIKQMRRGALRLDKDSLGRSNVNKRGPKSTDEGCTNTKFVTPEQLAFRDLIAAGYSPEDARVEAGLPPLR
jgi:hypothetical protein